MRIVTMCKVATSRLALPALEHATSTTTTSNDAGPFPLPQCQVWWGHSTAGCVLSPEGAAGVLIADDLIKIFARIDRVKPHRTKPPKISLLLPKADRTLRNLESAAVNNELNPPTLHSIPGRQDASSSFRYQAVHRDLPPKGRILYVQ
jgi:hypothetical protein